MTRKTYISGYVSLSLRMMNSEYTKMVAGRGLEPPTLGL